MIAPEERQYLHWSIATPLRQYNAQKGVRHPCLSSAVRRPRPEQYGFSQSDMRTDVFGAGRTLLYAACGCYRESQLDRVQMSRRLKRTILRATNLHPERRYPNGLALKQALQRCEKASRPSPAGCSRFVCGGNLCRRRGAHFSHDHKCATGGAAAERRAAGQEASLADLWHLEYHEFCADNYQAMLDSALTSYAARDEQSLADACEALIAALYEDPSLLQGEKVDYALLQSVAGGLFCRIQRAKNQLWALVQCRNASAQPRRLWRIRQPFFSLPG